MTEPTSDQIPNSFTVIRSNWFSRELDPNAPIIAAAISILISLTSMMYWNNDLGLSSKLAATRNLVFSNGEVWRLWTTTLIHSDLKHLLSNLFLFFILGWFLNGYFGLFLFPISGLIVGGLLNAIVLPSYVPDTTLIGASGIVFYLGGVWLALYFLIQRQQTLVSRFLRVGGVTLALFMPSEAFDPSISYRTHFVGLLVGLAVGVFYFLINKSKFQRAEVRELIVEHDDTELRDSAEIQ